jgi:hypothetical protein
MLIETAEDRGQTMKPATVTRNLARRTAPIIPAYVLLYQKANRPNPAAKDFSDISSFRVRRLWPDPQTPWRTLTPCEWAEKLVELRKWGARKIDEMLFDRMREEFEPADASRTPAPALHNGLLGASPQIQSRSESSEGWRPNGDLFGK